MSRFTARWGSPATWHLTRGSGAGGVAPIPTPIDPGPDDYDDNGVFLGTPAVATYAGGKFSLTAIVGVATELIIADLQMGIADPGGNRYDAGFFSNADVVDELTVRALDQKATVVGSWSAFLTYSLDGTNYLTGAALTFQIASLT